MTGMKGTLKLSSVAEDEKSKLVPDEEMEAALPPPLGFLSAMAAAHRPLHVSGRPVRKPVTLRTSTLPHLRTRAGTPGCRFAALSLPLLGAART